MQVFYTPRYYADIGPGHVFPIRKFQLVRDKLLAEGIIEPSEIVEPSPAPLEHVLLVHTTDYISRLCSGNLTTKEIRRLGLPWSESLVQRSFYAVGGTLAATRASLAEGYSSNLAGGTPHSFSDRGEGSSFDQRAKHFLEKERIAIRFIDDFAGESFRQREAAQQLLNQTSTRFSGEWL